MKCDYAIELQSIFTSDGADECRGTAGYKWYGQNDAPNGASMPRRRRGDPPRACANPVSGNRHRTRFMVHLVPHVAFVVNPWLFLVDLLPLRPIVAF